MAARAIRNTNQASKYTSTHLHIKGHTLDLIEQARRETQGERQKQLWAMAQQKILEEVVAYPLCITKFVFARKNYVDLGYEMKSTLTLVDTIKWNTRILEK